jgi:hypothetical protein
MQVTLEVLSLVRGAIDAKIECWKNLTAAEKAMKAVELSEDDLENLVMGLESSSQLTNERLEEWIRSVVYMGDK